MSTTKEYVQGTFRDADTVHMIIHIQGGAVFHIKGFMVTDKERFVIMAKSGNYSFKYSGPYGRNNILHTKVVLIEKREVHKRLRRTRDESF
jgi:hypothetical protein